MTISPVIPYLLYEDAERAIEFLTRAFGFSELARTVNDAGRIVNCELRGPAGGDAWLGEVDAVPGRSVVYVYVDDVDAHSERARAEGARIGNEPTDQGYGDRRYDATDPEGNVWYFAHAISEDSPARKR